MKINVSNGKYTFINTPLRVDVLRGGQPWHSQSQAGNAIHALMCELDAARVVLKAARNVVDIVDGDAGRVLRDALKRHQGLVDDHEPPSEWAR